MTTSNSISVNADLVEERPVISTSVIRNVDEEISNGGNHFGEEAYSMIIAAPGRIQTRTVNNV